MTYFGKKIDSTEGIHLIKGRINISFKVKKKARQKIIKHLD